MTFLNFGFESCGCGLCGPHYFLRKMYVLDKTQTIITMGLQLPLSMVHVIEIYVHLLIPGE